MASDNQKMNVNVVAVFGDCGDISSSMLIAGAYPAIPKITADGIYGPATAEAVRVFQKVFGLPQTGEVDYTTWYKISEIYVGVSRIAELN